MTNRFQTLLSNSSSGATSGVLVTQTPRVIAAYEAHFDGLTFEEEKGWAVVSGVRNHTPASPP